MKKAFRILFLIVELAFSAFLTGCALTVIAGAVHFAWDYVANVQPTILETYCMVASMVIGGIYCVIHYSEDDRHD